MLLAAPNAPRKLVSDEFVKLELGRGKEQPAHHAVGHTCCGGWVGVAATKASETSAGGIRVGVGAEASKSSAERHAGVVQR